MASRKTQSHVALLRGINVGGKRKLPMADLTRIFEDAGGAGVRTYIQSGNVVFDAPASRAARVVRDAAQGIEDHFGFETTIVVRTAQDMARIIAANPFLKKGTDEKTLHVGFLDRAPGAGAVAKLDPDRSPPDRWAVKGTEIYLHFPNGVASTRLTSAYLDSTLGVVCTVRNWRTALRLTGMSSGEE